MDVDENFLNRFALSVGKFELIVSAHIAGNFLHLHHSLVFVDDDFHIFGTKRLAVFGQFGFNRTLADALDCGQQTSSNQ